MSQLILFDLIFISYALTKLHYYCILSSHKRNDYSEKKKSHEKSNIYVYGYFLFINYDIHG